MLGALQWKQKNSLGSRYSWYKLFLTITAPGYGHRTLCCDFPATCFKRSSCSCSCWEGCWGKLKRCSRLCWSYDKLSTSPGVTSSLLLLRAPWLDSYPHNLDCNCFVGKWNIFSITFFCLPSSTYLYLCMFVGWSFEVWCSQAFLQIGRVFFVCCLFVCLCPIWHSTVWLHREIKFIIMASSTISFSHLTSSTFFHCNHFSTR